MRFLLDEDLNPLAAEIGRGLGLDAVSVHEIDRLGYSDAEQLAYAASEERIMVTRNRNDYILLTRQFYHMVQPHAGLLIVPGSLPNDRADRIAHALKRWEEEYAGSSHSFGSYFIDFLKSSR